MQRRLTKIKRVTKETRIEISLDIDGSGKASIKTGIPFFDHMLTLFTKHAVVNLWLKATGDLEVDAHHTVEDCGIVLGQAFAQALGDKKGIRRYGSGFHPKNPFTGEAYVPMDECLARCVIDFSGAALFGLAWIGQRVLQETFRFRKKAGFFDSFPLWIGARIFSSLCKRSPLQPSHGTSLRQ